MFVRCWNFCGCVCVFAMLLVSTCGAETKPIEAEAARAWARLPGILRRIVPPRFPNREFDLTNYGAVADGKTLCTAAFRAAIAACNQAGGGRVLVPEGKYFTGPIHLKSNVELYLSKGAELIFSDRFEDYLPPVLVRVGGIEIYNYSPLIYARDCHNLAITGPGKLNGNAQAWWAWQKKETREFFDMGAKDMPVKKRIFGTPEAAIRPSFVSFVSCKNVLLEGFTIGSGPNWTIHPIYCRNMTIRGVNVDTDGPNNDGIDPDSCKDLLIENCTFSTGDDCVVLKSGYNEDGWRVGKPTENVIMRNCSSKRGHGGLVIGSEMSGDVRNVFMEDCRFDGTDRAIRIKSRRGRGGVVENIWARNLTANNMQREVIILNMDYSSDQKLAANTKPPIFRNMMIENVTGQNAPTAILLQALADSPIQNICFKDIHVTSTNGVIGSNLKNLVFDNVNVSASKPPIFDFSNAENIKMENVASPTNEVFMKLAGRNSSNIVVHVSDNAPKILIGKEIASDAVKIE